MSHFCLHTGGISVAAFVSGGYLPAAVRGTTNNGIVHLADWCEASSDFLHFWDSASRSFQLFVGVLPASLPACGISLRHILILWGALVVIQVCNFSRSCETRPD